MAQSLTTRPVWWVGGGACVQKTSCTSYIVEGCGEDDQGYRSYDVAFNLALTGTVANPTTILRVRGCLRD